MKIIRRGVQDWEYLYLLEQLTGSKEASLETLQLFMASGDHSYASDLRTYHFTEGTIFKTRALLADRIQAAGGEKN